MSLDYELRFADQNSAFALIVPAVRGRSINTTRVTAPSANEAFVNDIRCGYRFHLTRMLG